MNNIFQSVFTKEEIFVEAVTMVRLLKVEEIQSDKVLKMLKDVDVR